ncbi:MAG TPA: hypothetical protein VHX19_01260 [Stellaceae bacterium]|jgi:hypothetical protein|nr:hypothetical protein [Stellaceae bacterium]
MIAQIDELELAVIALAVDPAGDASVAASVDKAQSAAGGGAILMHGPEKAETAGVLSRYGGVFAAIGSDYLSHRAMRISACACVKTRPSSTAFSPRAIASSNCACKDIGSASGFRSSVKEWLPSASM